MPQLKLVPPARPDSAREVARSFESPTAEVLAQHFPASERATLYVLILMIVAIVVFMSFAKLDRIVKTTGRLVPIAGTLTVQPLNKQIISRILVSVGDIVKKGQILATCDPTLAQADRIRLEQQIASLDAQTRRMTAEEHLAAFTAQPNSSYDALQASIFQQRQTEFRSGVNDFDQRIRSAEAQLAGLRQNIGNYKARLKIGAEMSGMHSKLARDGYVSRMQLLNVQDQQVELGRLLAEAESTLVSTLHLQESLKEQRKVYIDKWHDDNLNNLVTAQNALDGARQDFAKAAKLSELVNLVAPDDAIVTKIPTLTAGAVATDAQPLFSLVPVNAPLEADVQIDSQDIGFVKVGDPVKIKFDAYKFLEHGTGKGVVKTLSQDSFTNVMTQDAATTGSGSDKTRSSYFDARVRVTEVQLHDVPAHFRLIPGMTINADIVVGSRTIMWYLLGGALRTGAEAMHEP